MQQRSELISEMTSGEAGLNELMHILLDSFSKQEHSGGEVMVSVLAVGGA